MYVCCRANCVGGDLNFGYCAKVTRGSTCARYVWATELCRAGIRCVCVCMYVYKRVRS